MRTALWFWGSLLIVSAGCTAPAVAPPPAPASTSNQPAASSKVERPLSYADKLKQAVRRNIILSEPIEGNPVAEVEVRTAQDGAIIQTRLITSSGSRAWDDAVLNALRRMRHLPLDVDGRIPPVIVITFRPWSTP